MIKLKQSVRPSSLVILAAIANVAQLHGREVTITSGNDSTHKKGSRHYINAALDVRSKDFPSKAVKLAFVVAVLARLGPDYEGFLEAEGTANEHFHFERQVFPLP